MTDINTRFQPGALAYHKADRHGLLGAPFYIHGVAMAHIAGGQTEEIILVMRSDRIPAWEPADAYWTQVEMEVKQELERANRK